MIANWPTSSAWVQRRTFGGVLRRPPSLRPSAAARRDVKMAGRQAEEPGGHERDRRQRPEQRGVHLEVPVGHLRSGGRRRERQGEPRESESQDPRHRRHHKALDQQPPHDSPLRCADRQADRDLARPIPVDFFTVATMFASLVPRKWQLAVIGRIDLNLTVSPLQRTRATRPSTPSVRATLRSGTRGKNRGALGGGT